MGAREAGSPQCTTPEHIRLSPHISPIQISPEPPRRTTYDAHPPARRSLSPVLASNEWFAVGAPGGAPLSPLKIPPSAWGRADSRVVSFDDQPGSATSNLSSESERTRCPWSTGQLLMSLGCVAIGSGGNGAAWAQLGIIVALVVLQLTKAESGGSQGVYAANVTSNRSSVSPSPPGANTQPPPSPPPPPYVRPVQIPPPAQQPPTSPRAPLSTLPNLRILPEAYTTRTCNATAWGAYRPVPFGRAPPGATASSPPEGTRLDTITGTWVVVREQAGRKEIVRQALRHAWRGYVAHAWGYDELKPVSRRGVDNFGGLGLTIVDSLSTLWLMEMWQEFDAAREWVGTNLTFDKDVYISVFEINIRILGGLLSAYDLSGDRMFLDKATDLGRRMMWAFESPTRVPYTRLNLRTGVGVFHQMRAETSATFSTVATLSEVGTLMLEFNSLTRHTGDPAFERVAARAMELLYEVTPPLDDHLMPIHFEPRYMTWNANRVVSFGANGDSFYEYLLKASVQRQHSPYFYILLSMWGRTMDDMIGQLTQLSAPSRLQFIAERYYNTPRRNMDHLACFVPGMLLLGDHLNVSRAGFNYTAAAAEYLETCWQMYAQSACGLAPESVYFPTTPDPLDENPPDMTSQSNPYNYLRPETLESIFIMFRRTGDPKYREMGWAIFQAFETHCKVDSGGYSGLRNVNSGVPPKGDQMQSYFLAETLKYLYLLFSDSSVLPLDVWVLNTEAHPLRIQCV